MIIQHVFNTLSVFATKVHCTVTGVSLYCVTLHGSMCRIFLYCVVKKFLVEIVGRDLLGVIFARCTRFCLRVFYCWKDCMLLHIFKREKCIYSFLCIN